MAKRHPLRIKFARTSSSRELAGLHGFVDGTSGRPGPVRAQFVVYPETDVVVHVTSREQAEKLYGRSSFGGFFDSPPRRAVAVHAVRDAVRGPIPKRQRALSSGRLAP